MAMKTTCFSGALVLVALAALPLPAFGAADPISCEDSQERRQDAAKNRTEQAKETADSWFSDVSEEVKNCVSGLAKPNFGASDGLPNNMFDQLIDEACDTAMSEVNGTIDSTMSEIDGAAGGAVDEATGGYFNMDVGTTTGSVDSAGDMVDVDASGVEETMQSFGIDE